MKRILVISGSRADYGLLEWPVKVLRESFDVSFRRLGRPDKKLKKWLYPCEPREVFGSAYFMIAEKPDCVLLLGDRWEILQAAIAAHLQRVPIAHIGGGDVTLGSYDDAMRDCISRLATFHFPTSIESAFRLADMEGYYGNNIEMVGNIALDYIMHGDWKRERPIAEPYVVVSYQAETIDGTVDWNQVERSIENRFAVFIRPNADAGASLINMKIDEFFMKYPAAHAKTVDLLPHAEFLNLLYHCDEFIGNSSAMLYEAPALGVKCRMIGKRQQGRVAPTGDGKASERIREVLCRYL